MKTCPKCKLSLSPASFGKSRSKKDGLQWLCRSCLSDYSRHRYQKNPEKHRQQSRKWHSEHPEKVKLAQKKSDLRRDYGLSLSDFEHKLTAQGMRCAICRDPLTRGKNGAHVDHDHATGKVREILCADCNIGLGRFKDCSDRLQAAVAYLKKHSS